MSKKKSATSRTAKSFYVLLIVFFIAMFSWWGFKSGRPDFERYEEFGIDIPSNFSIHGIDVSKYQQRIQWQAVKEMMVDEVRIGFVFIKATEGLGNMDQHF